MADARDQAVGGTDATGESETSRTFEVSEAATEARQAERPEPAPEAARGTARPITRVGEPVLHRPCRRVTAFDAELSALIDDMFASMYAADGVGLAANQIGVDAAVFVYDCPDDEGVRHVGHVVNPVLEELDPSRRRLDEAPEGCLSVPGAYEDLARPDYAVVRGQDRDGREIVVEGTGYFSRCLQHETDHLNGYLYIDRLSKRGRRSALRQMEEHLAKADASS
ncbi:peptide deformylase [Allostreptomyces psammosilenae]|uniref:Peptide deformylase n=1 Tax=Allostreptomyces psammosilenae TaxID=1892865 RepID=A0A853A6J8_9ACTN|nr:peptide deformylase [Allostreptomyces psammosilenae]NYI06301.1 peptide deformylase [Allostreptomyces psammosilenae]